MANVLLYFFIYGNQKNNIFGYYDFIFTQYGPDTDLEGAYKFLLTNSYITKNIKSDEYCLGNYKINRLSNQPNFKERYDWYETIIYILATYGEKKKFMILYSETLNINLHTKVI
ncbi:hypothetical protein [Lacrimispora xylanisolvens]|uniref:hypothetical protein n=1 Tax=Lacrimispora xylanisolvens TaxID=384636 RepID=UPI002402BEBC